MKKIICSMSLVCLGLLSGFGVAIAAETSVPEPFRGFDPNSTYKIDYGDLTALLNTVVVDGGRSTREVAKPATAKIGTRMKAKVKRLTANEGNRFYFEGFKNNDEGRQYLRDIQNSLQELPAEAPLENFSRDEQLAYLAESV